MKNSLIKQGYLQVSQYKWNLLELLSYKTKTISSYYQLRQMDIQPRSRSSSSSSSSSVSLQRKRKGRSNRHARGKMTSSQKKIRDQKKQQRRQQKNKDFKQIFLNNKVSNTYYDKEKDQYQMEGYYNKLKSLDYDSLSTLISSTWKHARRRQNLFPIVDRQPDWTLKCLYSGQVLSDAQGNMLAKCNEEHSFPQSFQKGKRSGTGRDMHAIFATGTSANGSRGNRPFGLVSPNDKLVEQTKYGKIYQNQIFKKKTFVPNINVGAVARATLYILVCYKGCANPEYFPKQLLNWTIETATKTPVSQWEKHRNAELFKLQQNRNPFIDHPQWALKLDFSNGWQGEK